MTTTIGWNRYGKMNVKMLRVVRDTPRHTVHEFNAQIMLSSTHLASSYTLGDNSYIVPTETQKNTLYVLSKQYPIDPMENWTVYVGKDFLRRHAHIEGVFLHVDRLPWERVVIDGKEHNHAFVKGSRGVRFCTTTVNRKGEITMKSGFKDLTVMKTTQSGFSGYIKDEYTTLKETTDRIMSTKIYCEWEFSPLVDLERAGMDFNDVFERIHSLIILKFSGPPPSGAYSASVQHTVYDIGSTILNIIPDIQRVTFKLPNVHYYLVDFADFKTQIKNEKEVFFTFDGAHGQIEATVERQQKKSRL